MPLSRTAGVLVQSRRPVLGLRPGPSPLDLLLLLIILLTSPLSSVCGAPAPPKFTKIPTDQIGVSGGVASFVCQASGNPKPVVYWNKKGKKVNSQRIETVEFDEGAGAVLRIQPLRAPRDENIYECVARNIEGEVSVTAKLAIIRGGRGGRRVRAVWAREGLGESNPRAPDRPLFGPRPAPRPPDEGCQRPDHPLASG